MSEGLNVFYNKDLKLFSDIKTNMLLPINFDNYKTSIKYVKNQLTKKQSKKISKSKSSKLSKLFRLKKLIKLNNSIVYKYIK